MTPSRFRSALGLGLAWLTLAFATAVLAAEASPCSGVASGDEDGIGGTGLGPEDGIGGTGIYGAITELGSICVNGLHVEFEPDFEVWQEGQRVEPSALAVGQVVWLVAESRGDRLATRRIDLLPALRGPVSGVSASGALRVAGVTVEVPEGVDRPDLAAGDPVEVSGLWQGQGALLATRIQRLAAPVAAQRLPRPDLAERGRGLARLSVEGWVAADAPGPRLLGLELAGRPAERLNPGERVWLRGRLLPSGRLAVDRLERPAVPERPTRPTRPPAPDARRGDRGESPEDGRSPRPPRPDPPQRPERPESIERPTTIDRIQPVEPERTDTLR